MYELEADAVYITQRAHEDPRCRARIERILPNLCADHTEVVTDARLNDIATEREWARQEARRTGELRRGTKLTVVLNRFEWLNSEGWWRREERFPSLTRFLLNGNGAWSQRKAEHFAETMDSVCQSAWELHCAYGCPHSCAYCHVGDLLNIMLNLEELADRAEEFIRAHRRQRLYKFDNYTDTICLEPEYGASQIMVERFAEFARRADVPDVYLMLYTKSDNVGHLLDLDHAGRTIVNWTLSGATQSALIERGAPPSGARIAAARQCQDAGYTVRVRFSPIVPVETWRDEYRELIARMFEHIEPDIITFDVLGWMSAQAMDRSMDLSLLDAPYREEIERQIAAGEEHPTKHVFPHPLRREVLRFVTETIRAHRRDTRLAICNETFQMWAELGPHLGQEPGSYHCCCGPISVPGML